MEHASGSGEQAAQGQSEAHRAGAGPRPQWRGQGQLWDNLE